jgi:tetratricopeptide (TPR) repeat protein
LILASIVSTWQAVRATRAEQEAREQTQTARRLKGDIDYDRNLYRDFWLARAYERRGQTNEAIELFVKLRPQLAAAFPQHRSDCEEVAKFFVRMGRYDEARAAYEPIRASLEADFPREPTDFQRLIEATAASKGWPAAAETCRRHFDLLPREPIAWRSKAITLLYSGDEAAYAKATAAAISLVNTATNSEDIVAILETAGLGAIPLSTEQTNQLTRALERIVYLTPDRQERGRAARAGALLRLGRFQECIRQTQSALAWKFDPMGPARVCALGALCRYRLGDAEMAYDNFVSGDGYTRFSPLWNLEALGESEPFLTESERYYLVLRREELATIPGARADSLARQNRLREAAAEAGLAIEREPTNVWHYHNLAPLLLAQQDLDGYRALCRRIVSEFKETTNSRTARVMANACLIIPASGADPVTVSNLVRVQSRKDVAEAWFTRALAEYRRGNFPAAMKRAQEAVNYAASYGGEYEYVEARMLLAMSQYQLQRTNESRLMLSEGLKLARLQEDNQGAGDMGYDWRARFRGRALMKEARVLIEPK